MMMGSNNLKYSDARSYLLAIIILPRVHMNGQPVNLQLQPVVPQSQNPKCEQLRMECYAETVASMCSLRSRNTIHRAGIPHKQLTSIWFECCSLLRKYENLKKVLPVQPVSRLTGFSSRSTFRVHRMANMQQNAVACSLLACSLLLNIHLCSSTGEHFIQ